MPKNQKHDTPKQKAGKVLLLPVEQIEPSPYQARTTFDETEIAALAVSILQNGLLQPVSVRRTGPHRYQLIAGERRLRACRLAKLARVPAILADCDDGASAALGLLENLQRAQLDPFDTARGIKEVIRLWGCTQAEAARRLGLSQSALANKLRLLSLSPAQQQICTAHHLTERHARAALRLPESRRTAALEKMARDGLSVRDADKLVDAMLSAPREGPSPVRRTMPMVRDVRLFVNTLQHAVDLMTQKGIPATATCGRRDGCLEYTVRIPVDAPDEAFAVIPAPLPAGPAPQRRTAPPACLRCRRRRGRGGRCRIASPAGFNGAPPCFGAATAPASARWPHEKPGSDSSRWKAPPPGQSHQARRRFRPAAAWRAPAAAPSGKPQTPGQNTA